MQRIVNSPIVSLEPLSYYNTPIDASNAFSASESESEGQQELCFEEGAEETNLNAIGEVPQSSNAVDSDSPQESHASNDSDLSNENNRNKKKKKAAPRPEMTANSFSFQTSLYKLCDNAAMYNELYDDKPSLTFSKTKYFIETEHNGVGHLDLLFASFCSYLKMQKLKNLPMDGGEKVFCWLGKRKAMEILPHLRPDHHFVNRLPLDIYLKDKQSMVFTLRPHVYNRGATFQSHYCPYQQRKLHLQMACDHQYTNHNFEDCNSRHCFHIKQKTSKLHHEDSDVHDGPLCPCFRSNFFVPETRVFSSQLQQNVFIEETNRLAPDSQWIVKPSYMRSGHGVRIMSSAEQLRKFFKLESNRHQMWGHDYVVQRYIQKPMLTKVGCKFDVRMFLQVIVCKYKRVLGLLHPGYIRKVPDPYVKLEKGEKYKARQHLATTRVWRKYGPVPVVEVKKEAGKTKKQPRVSLDPVPCTGFFAENFEKDECEEYNYAVRHGCLKGNVQKLPLIQGSTKIPPFGTEDLPVPTTKNEREAFHCTNNRFLWDIDAMVNGICASIFNLIKDKSNCYQIFSLDICIDESGKPWVLEVNPTIITEGINWKSKTLREIVPAVFTEALGLTIECTRKSSSFMALRTPKSFKNKPRDLVLRQNFLWLYSTPVTSCDLFEMKKRKYDIEHQFKVEVTSKAIQYEPVDYFPKKNKQPETISAQPQDGSKKVDKTPRCEYRFPTPVVRIPVLEEDVKYSFRYTEKKKNLVQQQDMVRRMQRRVKARKALDLARERRKFSEKSKRRMEQSKMRVNVTN